MNIIDLNTKPQTYQPPPMFPQFVHHMSIHSLKAIIYAQNLRPINLRRRCLVRWSLMMLRFGISAMSLVMKSPRSPSRTCIGDTTFNNYIYSNNRIYEYIIYLAQWFKLHGWVYNPFYNTCQEPPGSSVAQLNPASTGAMEEMVSAIPDPQWAMSMLEQCLQMEWANTELTQDCQGLKPYAIYNRCIYSMTCPQSMRIPHGFVLNGGCCRHPPCGKTSELVFAWCRSYWWNNQEVVFTRTGSHGRGFLVRTVATLLLLLTELALLVDPY